MSDFIVQPMHNNLLIKKVDLVEEAKIVVAGQQKEQTQNTARVLAVGPGRRVGAELVPVCVKVGDLILTGGQVSTYRVADEKFALISENSVVGIVNESLVKVKES